MVAVKAHFDGKQIVLPEQLQGATPREVVVVFDDGGRAAPQPPAAPSIFDVIGQARLKRSAKDIDRQVRDERASWDDR